MVSISLRHHSGCHLHGRRLSHWIWRWYLPSILRGLSWHSVFPLARPLTLQYHPCRCNKKATSAPIETRLDAAAPQRIHVWWYYYPVIHTFDGQTLGSLQKAILIETSWGTEERRSITSLYSCRLNPLIHTALNESKKHAWSCGIGNYTDMSAKAVRLIMVRPFSSRPQELSQQSNSYYDEEKMLNSPKGLRWMMVNNSIGL